MFSFTGSGRKLPKASTGARSRPHAPAPSPGPPAPAPSSAPQSPQWSSHRDKNTDSKALRILGTRGPPSHSQSPVAPIADEYGVDDEQPDPDTSSATATLTLHNHPQPPISTRSSSNVLGPTYRTDGELGSSSSIASSRLHRQASHSTMRSHYDAKNSPLSISQQTSNSAVRDMALRRGQPSVVAYHDYHAHTHEPSPISPRILDPKDRRKSKPTRLDLTKLFPKPRTGDGHSHSLLSPNKMVKSPAAMSYKSADYLPRSPPKHEMPSQPSRKTHKYAPKSLRSTISSSYRPDSGSKRPVSTSQHSSSAPQQQQQQQQQRSSSPVRLYKRDTYDNAKVHVRRPPKGVQHWFDALDEDDSEEDMLEPTYEQSREPISAYGHSRQPSYERSREPAYEPPRKPTYERSREPEYEHSRKPTYERSREPEYEHSREPAYGHSHEPAYEPSYESSYVSQASRSVESSRAPTHKASLGSLQHLSNQVQQSPRSQHSVPTFRNRGDTFSHDDIVDLHGLTSSSQHSLHTQGSCKSQKTKASKASKASSFSKSNLQSSSILSFSSSSEDENEAESTTTPARSFSVRKSLDFMDDSSEIVIGQAEAYEVRSRRRPSVGMSIKSTSTNAATIDIVYTPEPFNPPQFPQHNYSQQANYSQTSFTHPNYGQSNCSIPNFPQQSTSQPSSSGYASCNFSQHAYSRNSTYSSRRSSHARQPSIIIENDEPMPSAASLKSPLSPSNTSVRSARTSASEPKPRTQVVEHKVAEQRMMAVTREEEVLLELMRKKRASMSKKSLQNARARVDHDDTYSSPGSSLSTTKPASIVSSKGNNPVRVVETKSRRKASTTSSASSAPSAPSASHLVPPREKPTDSSERSSSKRRDNADSGVDSASTKRTTLPHHIPALDVFLPLDPVFSPASPAQTTSANSYTTAEQFSPLPSPITPGMRLDRDDVKIARSETSTEADDTSFMDPSLIDIASMPKPPPSLPTMTVRHERSRTASTDCGLTTDLAFPVPPSFGTLTPVTESRPPSIVEPPVLPARNTKRTTALPPQSTSARSSVISNASSSASAALSNLDVKPSPSRASRASMLSVGCGSVNERNSVSEDILAAWGSLGGTY